MACINFKALSDFAFTGLNVAEAALKGDQPLVKSIYIKSQFRDVITLWSTMEGFASFRDPITGSEFIQSLCEQLRDFAGKNARDLYEAFLDVNQDVTNHMTEVEFPYGNEGNYVSYLVNQTPLFKTTANRKVEFKKSNFKL